jgi:hypothetical protein
MNRTQSAVTLAVVAVAGLVGGSITEWLRPGPLHAPRGTRQVVRARCLHIVDEAGQNRVTIDNEGSRSQPQSPLPTRTRGPASG